MLPNSPEYACRLMAAAPIQAALDSLMAGRTVVIVAHRLSTIINADKIVVFHKGVVIEQVFAQTDIHESWNKLSACLKQLCA